MSTLIGSYTNDESSLFQFAQTTLDGSFRHTYLLTIGCVRKCAIFLNSLIEQLCYRVSKLIYRVRNRVYRVKCGFYRVRGLRFVDYTKYCSAISSTMALSASMVSSSSRMSEQRG